jgi:hypothetical protein
MQVILTDTEGLTVVWKYWRWTASHTQIVTVIAVAIDITTNEDLV